MQRIYCATWAFVLAVGLSACGDSSDRAPQFSDAANAQPISDTSGAAASEAAAPEDATDDLPGTASPLPAIGVIATLSLGGAAAIRRLRRPSREIN